MFPKHRLTFALVICLLAACAPSPSPMPVTSEPTETKVTEEVIAFYSDRDGNPEIYALRAMGAGWHA